MTRLLMNREISWLEFNKRVLYQVIDQKTPLLERLMFLSIYGSNLDEFFMVRIGSLSDQMVAFPEKLDEKTGESAKQQIKQVFSWLDKEEGNVRSSIDTLFSELKKHKIIIDSNVKDNKSVKEIFVNQIKPLLSPQIIDPHHPFPFINNKEMYVMAKLTTKDKGVKYGIIPLEKLNKMYRYQKDDEMHYCFIQDIIHTYCHQLFKKYHVEESVTLRATRNADVDVNNEMMDEYRDFAAAMQKVLSKRKRQNIIRLQIDKKISKEFMEYLSSQFKVNINNIVVNKYPLDLSFGHRLKKELTGIIGRAFIYPEVTPTGPVDFAAHSGIKYLESNDLLIHYPYHSSQTFIQLLYEAANNKEVKSIKITLYRLANTSFVASALAYAAEKGKEVVCVMELRARFDEQSNIDYSKILEDSGCKVVYGLTDYKVHSKLCLITYVKNNEVKYITYIGTGNFNESTQEQYTDLAQLTSDYQIGLDAQETFDALLTNTTVDPTPKLWIAPNNFRTQIVDHIEKEIRQHRQTHDGEITLKVNSMNDVLIMNKLMEASLEGVKVNLIVRGICCLIPQVEGFTENIMVKSILGRHLEHSRLFRFGPKSRAQIFLGSGDFLNRNTQRRVEAFIEVTQPELKEDCHLILDTEMREDVSGWIKQSDMSYKYIDGLHSQDILRNHFAVMKDYVKVVPKQSIFSRIWSFFTGRK